MADNTYKLKATTKNKMRFKKNVPFPKPPQTATQGPLAVIQKENSQ